MSEGERQECLRVPLWVGAVGHRALSPENDAALRRAVGEVLDDVKQRWGAALEPRLLTSLAEGADQLVAEQARARGWPLGVPLPLPESVYEHDFGSHVSLETFRRLRGEAALVFDVGLAPGVSLDQVREPGAEREAQYARAGRVVAATCPIVIALWDGEERNLVGGTSELIARVLCGWREEDDGTQRLNPQQPKLVYHIWTPSRERPDVTGIPFTWRVLSSQPEDEPEAEGHVLSDVLARLGEFDRDVCSKLREHTEACSRSAADAIPPEHAAGLPREIRDLLRWYGIADALALQYQRLVRWALPTLLVVAVLAFTGYELHTYWPSTPVWGLELFLLSFLAMIASVRSIKARAHERKFLDYRALAEGLRVQLFWRLGGRGGSVRIDTPLFLASETSEVTASAPGGPEFAGSVVINAPDVDVAGTIAALPEMPLDATQLLRERCAARRSGDAAGSFVVAGRDGGPPTPTGLLGASLDAGADVAPKQHAVDAIRADRLAWAAAGCWP